MNYNCLPSKSNKQWRRNGFSKIWELRSGSIGVMCSCVSQEMKFGMLRLAILFVFVESLAYNFWNNTNKVLPILLQIDHSFKRWLLLITILGESRHILYNNIDSKVCFIILWKPSSLGIPSSSLKNLIFLSVDIFLSSLTYRVN